MYIKSAIAGLLAISTASAFASFVHQSGGIFLEDGIKIEYPCGAGGEPLVIYSTSLRNATPISSKSTITPIYVKPGFKAGNLEVGENTTSELSSSQHFIVENVNPAYENNYITFQLNREDGNNFFVNSVNFASIDVSDTDRYVSSVKVVSNSKVIHQSATPTRMYAFDQDWGVFVYQNVKQIKAYQYAWNQNGLWEENHESPRYPIKYRFAPLPQADHPVDYNGFGFWICGDTGTQQHLLKESDKPYFFDKITKN